MGTGFLVGAAILALQAGGLNERWVLTSPSFTPGGTIPERFTCMGTDLSPTLSWTKPPERAESLALVMEDLDDVSRSPVTLWMIWNLPPEMLGLVEGIPSTPTLGSGARQGANDFTCLGYSGPCPPPGRPHRFRIRLLALDGFLSLPAGARRPQFDKAVKGRIVGETELIALFGHDGTGTIWGK